MYDQQILKILSLVDEHGISVASLTMHIYNQNSTLFSQPDLQEIGQYVRKFLRRHSKSSQPIIEHAEKRGYYRLNKKGSKYARELFMQFQEEDQDNHEEESNEATKPDLSLPLFDDF